LGQKLLPGLGQVVLEEAFGYLLVFYVKLIVFARAYHFKKHSVPDADAAATVPRSELQGLALTER
jgi:hypothetical protein